MGAHTDFMGPLLFVGGVADGYRYSVNISRDEWVIPQPVPSPLYAYDPGETTEADYEPHVYDRRTIALGSDLHRVSVDVMIWNRMEGRAAYVAALEHIAALVNGGDRQ